MIRKIAFVAQPTRDMERAKRFYGEILQLEPDCDYPGWAEFTTPDGKTIALDTYSADASPEARTYLALETDDIEGDTRRLAGHGAKIVRDVWTNENAEGREICRMAVLLDSEGNWMMLHQTAAWRLAEGHGRAAAEGSVAS